MAHVLRLAQQLEDRTRPVNHPSFNAHIAPSSATYQTQMVKREGDLGAGIKESLLRCGCRFPIPRSLTDDGL